jgi:hypothetical protein
VNIIYIHLPATPIVVSSKCSSVPVPERYKCNKYVTHNYPSALTLFVYDQHLNSIDPRSHSVVLT